MSVTWGKIGENFFALIYLATLFLVLDVETPLNLFKPYGWHMLANILSLVIFAINYAYNVCFKKHHQLLTNLHLTLHGVFFGLSWYLQFSGFVLELILFYSPLLYYYSKMFVSGRAPLSGLNPYGLFMYAMSALETILIFSSASSNYKMLTRLDALFLASRAILTVCLVLTIIWKPITTSSYFLKFAQAGLCLHTLVGTLSFITQIMMFLRTAQNETAIDTFTGHFRGPVTHQWTTWMHFQFSILMYAAVITGVKTFAGGFFAVWLPKTLLKKH